MSNYSIKTKRLGLRNWQAKDIEPATLMNADKAVMEFFPNTLTQQQTESFIKRMQLQFNERGFCYFAVDRLDTNQFIGFIGLSYQTYESVFTPCVDVGWRLLPEAWGNGFAIEGAKACLNFAFAELHLDAVYAIAPELNKKSQYVMQKLRMNAHTHFEHPNIDANNPLRKCVTYKISKSDYEV